MIDLAAAFNTKSPKPLNKNSNNIPLKVHLRYGRLRPAVGLLLSDVPGRVTFLQVFLKIQDSNLAIEFYCSNSNKFHCLRFGEDRLYRDFRRGGIDKEELCLKECRQTKRKPESSRFQRCRIRHYFALISVDFLGEYSTKINKYYQYLSDFSDSKCIQKLMKRAIKCIL